ncbi:CbbX protein [Rhodovibrio salinarum]|uniref:CbbX protein n=1 Tax=Rhodovibrio salinarum TaxID=1087 RepID=A0A934QGP0_9PROT|nr:CbbX protein [Rhodovibrio salinarum]MBK1696180.1 CbbX protein [Rhodovibrio salinarum]
MADDFDPQRPSRRPRTQASGTSEPAESGREQKSAEPAPSAVDLGAEWQKAGVQEVLDELDRQLIGLQPVKRRIRETAALLLVERARTRMGLTHEAPTLHMSFTGNPGTGKTTVAMRMADLLHRLGYLRRGHVVNVSRDDLVGQYIGHTAPKTKEVVKKAMGGVLFIDEAYNLYRPENERDYGHECIEILLQVMENHRDDLVVILAGYTGAMAKFFQSNPGFRSRIAHHIDFPDFQDDELLAIAKLMLGEHHYKLTPAGEQALQEYIAKRRAQPHFANARSVRNALDRARLRQAMRLFETADGPLDAEALSTIDAPDIYASRVFKGGLDSDHASPENDGQPAG